jgi:hypothetical protein
MLEIQAFAPRLSRRMAARRHGSEEKKADLSVRLCVFETDSASYSGLGSS